MKLIDILVQELPKHGGWPEGAVECCRFVDEANIDFYDASGNWPIDCGEKYGAIALKAVRKKTIPRECEKVVRKEYEAALAASLSEWNVGWLPSVGCIFEYGSHRSPAKCIAIGNDYVFAQRGEYGSEDYEEWLIDKTTAFYPTSDKREDFIKACNSENTILGTSRLFRPTAGALYDAIAAGKIPHIQLI